MVNFRQVLDYVMGKQLPSGAFAAEDGVTPDTLVTSQIISLLYYLDVSGQFSREIRAAICYLYGVQLPSGSWTGNTAQPETLVTAWAICALLKSGLEITSDVLQKAWIWMMNRQKDDGAFVQASSIIRSNIYVQGYVMRTLALVDFSYQTNKEKGLKWLQQVQHASGGFGLYPNTEPDAAITAYVLHGINRYPVYNQGNLGQKARLYLLGSQRPDGSWMSTYPLVNSMEATAMVLFVLRLAGVSGEPITKGFAFLNQFFDLLNWSEIPLRNMATSILAFYYGY